MRKIAPPPDTNGILFSGDTTVEINSNVRKIVIDGYGDGVLGVAPGQVEINHTGNIYDAFRGINGHSLNGDVGITAFGLIDNSVEAAINGYAPNGSVTINFDGRITDAQNRGISGVAATTSGTGTVSITSYANIDAFNQAIYGLSVGGTTITSYGDLTSESSRGISAEASGGVASIESHGDVDTWDTSLYARSTGGNASVTSYGDITSRGNNGIAAESTTGTATVFSRGDVWAANQGIFANGQTGASIDSKGDITTDKNYGNDGLFAYSSGGPVSVTSVGDVSAENGRGVVAINPGQSSTATIYSKGDVTAKGDGVFGMGSTVTIEQYGDVSSRLANGISAYGSTGPVSITATGDVDAFVNGIIANTNTGNASIVHTGDVSATGGQGVRAQTGNGTATVDQTGNVWAKTIGVAAYGTGNSSATVNGNVYSDLASGIEVQSTGGMGSISGKGTVDAYTYGLLVNAANGASIIHTGDVTSRAGTAVEANASGGNVTVDLKGDITGQLFGIKAIGSGTNAVVAVTSKGDVTSTEGNAIHAQAEGAGGTATVISTGNVYAGHIEVAPNVYQGQSGIFVLSDGNASATSTGNVTSLELNGIYVQSRSGTATIDSKGTISAGNQGLFAFGATGASITSKGGVTADNAALFALTNTGNAIVTSTGAVKSNADRGIVAMTSGGGDAIITSTGTVNASNEAVVAFNLGSGDATVTQTGDVHSDKSTGIKAHVGSDGDATVTSKGTVTADVEGITAHVGHDGNASVDQTGDVTSNKASGIVAEVLHDGDATIVAKGNVQAKTQGVSALVSNDGDAKVTQTGNVTSSDAFGIRADVGNDGDATIVATGNVQSKTDGVTAAVGGDGDASVTFTGDVNSNYVDGTTGTTTGIAAIVGGTGDATIDSSGSVHSKLTSLLAVTGTGTASITHVGSLKSEGAFGANAVTTDGNVIVDISGGDITSQLFGIQGIAGGNNRSVDITFNGGTINALNSRGIYGEALGSGSTVTIHSTGNVNTLDVAIAGHANGNVDITSNGNIKTTFGRGIEAQSLAGAASVTSVGDVTVPNAVAIFAQGHTTATINSTGKIDAGNGRGLDAEALTGLASITSVGDVTSDDVALFARGGAGATINSTGNVTTDADAIYAETTGAGNVSITSRGDVKSNIDRGLTAINTSSGMSNVLIDSVGKVTARSNAITAYTTHGNATVYSTGDVDSDINGGIQAQSQGDGYAYIKSIGNVTSENVGIIAQAATGSATIEQTGNVTTNHTGIEALSFGSSASITSTGVVDVRLEGLKAIAGNGFASITQRGNVTSDESFGINSEASGNGNNSTVDVIGDVQAYETAIQSIAFGGNALSKVTSNGLVNSTYSNGIQAQATGSGSKATIDATGNVDSKFIGVFALADSDVVIDYTGNATSKVSDAILGQSNNGSVTIRSNGNQSGDQMDIGARYGIFALGYGMVDVTQVGDVTTGSDYRAIQAQSTNGNVKVDATGHIYVNGNDGDSDAIFAFAQNGHADVTIRSGSVITGGSDALASFGVEFGSAAGTNTLTNYGEINDANGGKTIGGDTAADVVSNYGLVDGDFYLAGGANRFDNLPGGWTYFKAYSEVGAGNDYNNTGFVSPFGPNVVGSSVLDSNFNQTGGGQFWADIDFASGNADYLDVTGNVTAGGTVFAHVTDLGTNVGPISATIIRSVGSVTDDGITGVDQGPLMVDVSTTGTTVDINVAIDFGVDNGLSKQAQPVGDFLQGLFETTLPGGLTPEQEAYYLGLINYGDTASYDTFLRAPAATAASIPQVFEGARAFTDNLFSCRQRDGTYKFVAEGTCVWAAGGGRSFSQGDTGDSVGFDDRSFSLSGGGQKNIDGNWAFGFGLGYENGESSTSVGLDLSRNVFSAGLIAKGTFGNAQIAAAVTGGGGTIDSKRFVDFPTPGTVTGERDVGFIGITGRASYVADMGAVYLKPMVEGAATYIAAGAYTESGGGVGDYSFEALDQLVGRGTASIELGSQFAAGDILLRPYIGAGATVLAGEDVSVVAGLPGLGPGTFTTTASTDSFYADIRAGIYAFGGSGWSTRLEYDGRFSANSQQHTGTLKVNIPF